MALPDLAMFLRDRQGGASRREAMESTCKRPCSLSLLEASLQSFEDLLHLLRLGVQANRPLPQCAVHLGGLRRYSGPH